LQCSVFALTNISSIGQWRIWRTTGFTWFGTVFFTLEI